MGLFCSKRKERNRHAEDAKSSASTFVDAEKALTVSIKEEEKTIVIWGQKTERGETDVIEEDTSFSPLLLDDTAWMNIHGGPKEQILEHLRNTQAFPEWTKPVKGILLYGPPGDILNFVLTLILNFNQGLGRHL